MGITIYHILGSYFAGLVGWVPETSRSFHYWQPAPRWRLLPWQANPDNPGMSAHVEGRKQAPLTLARQWKEMRGTGEGKQPLSRVLAHENQTLKDFKH